MRKLLGRLSVRRWSLRARLLAAVVGLVAVALATTGTVGVTLLRSYLMHQVDQQLAVGARVLDRATPLPEPPPTRVATQLPTPYWFTEIGTGGAVLHQRGGPGAPGVAGPDLSGVTAAKVSAEGGKAFTVPSNQGGSGYRVRAAVRPDGTISTIALSLQSADATVHQLTMITLAVALGVLAVLLVLATIAVRVGLRPLDVVEHTAEDIAAGDLSRRVPEGSPRTEIGRLSRTFNGMLAQIESAFAARAHSEATLRQFVADASHELRTPLTTVRGYAELARKGALPDPPAQRHAMRRIEAEATRMGGLVDDLLLLAHLDQRRPLHVETADVGVLTADAVADARVRDPDRPIDHTGPAEPVFVRVDADRLRQVLANLVGNALVHTPSGTPVQVTLSRNGTHAQLVVADKGPGLPPEQVARLFERFYRADPSRSRARGGSGLGLAIVEAVVQASGGTVSCTSAPGAGTSFEVRLPIS
ncbi:MAG TPA: HAMP domain-containing sensor histidine kinase [Jatrophihabitantaceae bacterium]|jgi:two-component system OmpR family sensor kinase